ncbi:MAG: retroviral-like aspartic protease family protein, partial [Cohaesibacter sp.]|nr:retroviral-like aspartic protease family protein [Cohaesibacter sp.]
MDIVKEPTKQKYYKYGCREDALAAKKKKDNRARIERRRRAVDRLTAANEEKMSPSMKKRGGKSSWKQSVRRKYNRDLRRQKQRKQRRQAVNRQIWQRLQALVPRAEETATSLMQLAKTVEERTRIHQPGEELLGKAMAGRHWVAIGGDEAQEMTNAGRKVIDGVLFRVTVSIAGRNCVALIDSGASQSYIAPETVTLCELGCSPALIHLELADGSKVQSTQQTLAVPCTVGQSVCKMSFTVTKLLSNVDVVLGMDWLRTWNPVIDWRRQKMYIWVQGEWDHVNGVLLETEQKIGTVKVFDNYIGDVTCVPDFTVIKEPKLWTFNADPMKCTMNGEKAVQKKECMKS